MIRFAGQGVLLDIEGTTSSIHFVYDVMFPFVRRELQGFLTRNWDSPPVQEACGLIARDAGHESLNAWCAKRQLMRLPLTRCLPDAFSNLNKVKNNGRTESH